MLTVDENFCRLNVTKFQQRDEYYYRQNFHERGLYLREKNVKNWCERKIGVNLFFELSICFCIRTIFII